MSDPPAVSEHGDRGAFLARLRDRLAGGVPENPVRPIEPLPGAVPRPVYRQLDPDDLLASFERAAAAVEATVHRAGGSVPEGLLATLVERRGVATAVVSREPEAWQVGQRLAALGVHVSAYSPTAAARADLGVTSAVAAVAATGSVVQDSTAAGGRGASLLPTSHLCVLPASRLVATPADVLRPLGADHPPPASLVVISGPSRSGDIEQIITLGVHGPTAVDVVLLGAV